MLILTVERLQILNLHWVFHPEASVLLEVTPACSSSVWVLRVIETEQRGEERIAEATTVSCFLH